MLRIGDTIFSFDVLEKKFRCNLPVCLGNCCRYGDSGAPLSHEETLILDSVWEEVRPFLREEGIMAIGEMGRYVRDFENDWVTPLVGNEECAYATIKNGIHFCGIEEAWLAGKTGFRKPLSCHLFPLRVKKYSEFTAVNYQDIAICKAGRDLGREEGTRLFEFLEDPLIRAFGSEVYSDLCIAAEELRKSGTIK